MFNQSQNGAQAYSKLLKSPADAFVLTEGAEFAGSAVRCPRRLWFLRLHDLFGCRKREPHTTLISEVVWHGKLILVWISVVELTNHGNLRGHSPSMGFLVRPYFSWGGGIGGVPLDSHDN